MLTPIRSTTGATIAIVLLTPFLALIPQPSRAIQLRWSTGASDTSFTANSRATVIVQAAPGEGVLPRSWRLLWAADSSGLQLVAPGSEAACGADTATVVGIEQPGTPTESAAHQITAQFCPGGTGLVARATYVFNLPANGRGNLKVVALDREDSLVVIESNMVTYNGGVSEAFPPAILTASHSRTSTMLRATAIGAELSAVEHARIVAPDTSWAVPLRSIVLAHNSVTATAEVPAALPDAVLEISTRGGGVASARISGDQVLAPTGDYSYGRFVNPIPNARPKDFAFFCDNLGHFHLFFINSYVGASPDTNERRLGHVWGGGLRNDWSYPDISSFTTSQSHSWDAAHVWAPNLLQLGSTYYMFYAGVDNLGNQTIGVATTSNINAASITWNRPATPIVTRLTGISWADQSGVAQCRDPFVMEDPGNPGSYVMLYTAQLASTGKPAIGIARSQGANLTAQWSDAGRLEVVDVIPELFGPYLGSPGKTESPHAFAHVNANADTSYYVLATGSDGAVPAHDRVLRNRRSPWDHGTDTGPNHWNLSSSLYDQLGFAALDPVVFGGWEASEYCRLYNHEYVAGINATIGTDSTYAVWIVMLRWLADAGGAPDQMALLNPVTDVGGGRPHVIGVMANGLKLAGRNPGSAPLNLEVALVGSQPADLVVHDVQGRRVRTLALGLTTSGRHVIQWDGRDDGGRPVACGVYFARLYWRTGQRTARMAVVR